MVKQRIKDTRIFTKGHVVRPRICFYMDQRANVVSQLADATRILADFSVWPGTEEKCFLLS